jgi:putative ABC transport system permease protein
MRAFFNILAQVFRSIGANKLRSFLTMFGIAWGVASLLLLVGLGEGFRSGQRRGLAELGTDVIMLWGGNIPALPGQHIGMHPYKLTLGDADAIRTQAANVRNATSILSRTDLKEVSEFSSSGGQVMGVEVNYPSIRKLPIAQGRFLNEDDEGEDGEAPVYRASFAEYICYVEWLSFSGGRGGVEVWAWEQ